MLVLCIVHVATLHHSPIPSQQPDSTYAGYRLLRQRYYTAQMVVRSSYALPQWGMASRSSGITVLPSCSFHSVENAVTLQYHHAVFYPTRMWLVPFDDMTLPLACHDGHMTLRPTFYNVPGLLKDGGSKARTNSVFSALLPHSDGK
jgi:hypothetical protein